MEPIRLIGLCVLCLLPVLLLKKHAPEQGLLLTLAVVGVALARSMALAAPLLEELRALAARSGLEGAHISVLLRALAAAIVTRVCGDLCKDGGSQAMATAVEIAGGVAGLVIALPLLEEVAGLLLGYLG